MNNSVLFADTNALIYLLNGDHRVSNLFSDCEIWISFVTEIELNSKKGASLFEIERVKMLLQECNIVDVNSQIKNQTSFIRRNTGLKLPDAIIAATCILYDIPLVTADKIFNRIEVIRIIFI